MYDGVQYISVLSEHKVFWGVFFGCERHLTCTSRHAQNSQLLEYIASVRI